MTDQLELGVALSTADKSPFLAYCATCRHVWPLVWTPCPAAIFRKLTRPFCPSCCATGNKIKVASKEAGHLAIYVQQLEVELERARKDADQEKTTAIPVTETV